MNIKDLLKNAAIRLDPRNDWRMWIIVGGIGLWLVLTLYSCAR